MNYEHFGNLLQELRIKYHMSREKLAQNICTPKQIYRIEKGESEPSIYLLHQLSIKFNLDLNEYYKMYFTSNTLAGLEGIKSINSAIENNNIILLNSLVEKYEKQKDFKKGENLQHIYYSKALCCALMDNNYMTSLEYCYKGLQIECPEFNIDKVSENMYSNVGITLIHCMSLNYFALNQYPIGMKVLTGLLKVLENFVIDSPYPMFHSTQFSQKIYQLVLYNIGVNLFEHGEIIKARNYIEKGIAYSLKEYNIRHLPNLLFMKFKILYREQKYEEAREFYNRAFYLYKITNKETILSELETTVKTDYPEIFKKNYT